MWCGGKSCQPYFVGKCRETRCCPCSRVSLSSPAMYKTVIQKIFAEQPFISVQSLQLAEPCICLTSVWRSHTTPVPTKRRASCRLRLRFVGVAPPDYLTSACIDAHCRTGSLLRMCSDHTASQSRHSKGKSLFSHLSIYSTQGRFSN